MPHLVNNSGKVRDWQKYQHLWIGRCPPQLTSRARGSLGRSLMGGGELRKGWNRMQMSALGLISLCCAVFYLRSDFQIGTA